jgi:hypothetical protein
MVIKPQYSIYYFRNYSGTKIRGNRISKKQELVIMKSKNKNTIEYTTLHLKPSALHLASFP